MLPYMDQFSLTSIYMVDSISLQVALFFRLHPLHLQNKRDESNYFLDLVPAFKLDYSKIRYLLFYFPFGLLF